MIKDLRIGHKLTKAHHLLKFVTEKTVAFLFGISVEQIYRIKLSEAIAIIEADLRKQLRKRLKLKADK